MKDIMIQAKSAILSATETNGFTGTDNIAVSRIGITASPTKWDYTNIFRI